MYLGKLFLPIFIKLKRKKLSLKQYLKQKSEEHNLNQEQQIHLRKKIKLLFEILYM